jgi:hypothetical protein
MLSAVYSLVLEIEDDNSIELLIGGVSRGPQNLGAGWGGVDNFCKIS